EIRFITNDTYNNDMNATYKFVVYQANTTVVITNESATVVATVNASATGKVTFIVNGVNKTVDIQNGVARWENVLVIGNNTVVAIYEGDVNFTSARNNTIIGVNKTKSLVNVTVNNTVYGNDVVIVVNVPISETGFVTIIVNNRNYTAEIKDGVASINVTGLKVDEYIVNVTYLGDDTYYNSTNSTTFNVTKANMSAVVTGLNVTVKDNIKFVIDNVTADFNGKVIISVEDQTYDDIVKALIEMGKLKAGNYTANVTFYGDNNYNNKTYKVNFTVFRVDPTITVSINDTTYPANATALINISDLANGTVTITVNGTEFTGVVRNGIATVNLTNLSGGSKVAFVNFTTSDDYNNNATATAKFIVNKANSTVTLSRNGTAVIATVNDGATGYITLIVNELEDSLLITNHTVIWEGVLGIGENYVTAIYEGDINYTSSRDSKVFSGNKTNSTVNVTATTVVYGNASEITVKVPTAQTGFVRITVNGTDINVTVEIIHGIAKFNATGLNVGRYLVNVTYLGDTRHDAAENFTYFNITKAEMSAVVTGLNVTVKDNVKFVIDNVIGDFTGNVTIAVPGLESYDSIVKALVEMGKLNAGNYTADVTFYGDNNYNNKTYKVNFTVTRVDPTITVRVNDTTYPNKAVAEVNVTDMANGTVKVIVDGKEFNGTMVNGTVNVDLTGLSGGVKEATVRFITNDTYNNNLTVNYKFIVYQANTTVIISNESATVVATVNSTATGKVTFIVNGVNNTVDIQNGVARWENVLVIGNNTVVAIYEGDVNFTSARNNTVIGVNKTKSLVNVTVNNTVYGNDVVIVVNVPVNETGFVTILVDGKNYTAPIRDGVATVNVTGLKVDEYTVNVTYLGDETYYVSSNFTTFNVTKANMSAVVTGLNVTVKDNIKFVIDNVTGDFNGNVTISVEDQT
ncbi:Ig-like domain repeat protein, partial [Methanobrevibacter sp.]